MSGTSSRARHRPCFDGSNRPGSRTQTFGPRSGGNRPVRSGGACGWTLSSRRAVGRFMRLDRLLRSSWQALSPSPWRPTDAPFVNSTTLEPSPTVYRPAKPERRRGSPSLGNGPVPRGAQHHRRAGTASPRWTTHRTYEPRARGSRSDLLGPRRVAPRRGTSTPTRATPGANLDALFAEAAQYVENVTGEKGLRRPKRQDPDLIKDLRRGSLPTVCGPSVGMRRCRDRDDRRCQDVRVPRCQESYKVELPEYQDETGRRSVETASMKYGLGGGGKVPVKRAVKVRCEPCAGPGRSRALSATAPFESFESD